MGWLEKAWNIYFVVQGKHLVLISLSFYLKVQSIKFLKFDEIIIIIVVVVVVVVTTTTITYSLVFRHCSSIWKILICAEKYGAINSFNRKPCLTTLLLLGAG